MTSTNDGKDVKSYQTSGPKAKTYYIELYKSLDGRLSGECELRERTRHLCEAWRRVHSLCQHSAPTTHPHLLSWLQRHTARTVLQTEWQSPKSKDEHNRLEDAINAFISETTVAAAGRATTTPAWEVQLLLRGEWFKKTLRNPWGHPVLRALLDTRGQKPSDDEILEWLKEERGVMFVTRLRQLAASKCDDLAMALVTAVMDRVRADVDPPPDHDQGDEAKAKPAAPSKEAPFAAVLRTEAGFTVDVWELLTDIEFVLLHKGDRVTRCIELSKQTPLRNGYQLVERLQSRLETSPREKKLWKSAKDVAILVAQVVIARCMVIPICAGVARTALYCCTRSLTRLLPPARLPAAAAALAAPAATARHLHTLAAAVDAQCTVELKPFVCELYVRAITAGMNELERLKLKTEKAPEARSAEQTLCSWFVQLGSLLSASARLKCECTLTAFSVHPTPAMYERIKAAPVQTPKAVDEDIKHETTSEFGSWATDSRTNSNLVKTSETLNIKQTQQSANVLSTAILTEGEGLGLAAEMCQDLAVLLSGPRVKTLSWDMDREILLENCRTYMERTHGGTRALTTELKYLNLDPSSYQHLPEEGDDENDVYYGIEKGYEHLVELQEQENIWETPLFVDEQTESACSSSMEITTPIRRKKKTKKYALFSDDETDPLCVFPDMKKSEKKKERPHSKERSKDRSSSKQRKKKVKSATDSAENKERSRERRKDDSKEKKDTTEGIEKKKERKPRKKKPKEPKDQPPIECKPGSLSSLIGMKVAKIKLPEAKFKRNAEGKTASCVTDSDYDSQGKSSLASLNSAGNDPDVLFDGLFSMDEYRSPEKSDPLSDRQPFSNSEVSFTNGQVAVSTATRPEKQFGHKIYNNYQSAPIQNVVNNVKTSDLNTNRNVNTVREEVKKSISKLLEYRRQKTLLDEAQRLASPTPLQNPLPSTYKSPNAIIRQKFPEETVISPKAVDVPEIPKVYINKKQVDQIKDLKNEVDSYLKAKFALKPMNEQVDQINDIKKEVDVFLKSKFSPMPVIQFAGKQNTDSTPQTQCTTNNENSQIASRIESLAQQGFSAGSHPNKQPDQMNQNVPAFKISEVSMQKNFQDFLQELQKSINAGTGVGAKKTTKSSPHPKIKKEKPTSKVASVAIPIVTVKAKPSSSPCAKSYKQRKKVETQLNTFSRLSYMHKNKQQNITPQELLNSIAEDHKISKHKYMQSMGDISISKRNTTQNATNNDVKQNVVRKVEKQTTTSVNHTVMTDNVSLHTKQGAIPKRTNSKENLAKKQSLESISIATPNESSLSEEDQNDLLHLLRQQSKLNVHPTPVIKTNVCKVNKIVNNPQCSKTSTAISTKSNSIGEVLIKKYPMEASLNITYNNKKVDDSVINMASDISQNMMYTKIVDCKTAKVNKAATIKKAKITPNKTPVTNMTPCQHVLNTSNVEHNKALKKYEATSEDSRQDWEKVKDDNNKKVDDSVINMASDILQNMMYTKIVDCKTAKVNKAATIKKAKITPNKITVTNMAPCQHVLNTSNVEHNNALKKYKATSEDSRQDWEKVMDDNNKKVDDSVINMASDISQNMMYTKIVDCKKAKVNKAATIKKAKITPNKTTVTNMAPYQHVLDTSNVDHNNALKKYEATSEDSRQDWEKVMDAILSHKTSRRGPNTRKKEKNLRNQRIEKPNLTKDAQVNNVAKQSTMLSSMSNSSLILPPHKNTASLTVHLSHTNMDLEQLQQSNVQSNYLTTAQSQKIQQEVDKIMQRYTQLEPTKNVINESCQPEIARESILCKQTNKLPKKEVLHQREVQVSCTHNAVTNKKNTVHQEIVKMVPQLEQYTEITAKIQKKPITTELLQAKDPFISGIPNSDYDLLEELMDDELRKEIGELSSDEDTYRAPTCTVKGNKLSNFDRSSNVIKSTPIRQENVYPISETSVRQNCRGTIIQNPTTVPKCQTIPKNINEMKVETSALNLAKVSNLKQYSKDRMLTSKFVENNSVTCTSVIHQPINTDDIISNKNNEPPPSIITNSQINVVDARNVIITALPQTALQNVVLIGSDLVYDPYATMQTQLNSNICNVNQTPYVTFNNNPNITVYQSTQFTAPAVNSKIIGNAMAVPLSTTSSEMLSACLDTDMNRTNSSNQTPVPLPATPSEILDRPLASDIQQINSINQNILVHNSTRFQEEISSYEEKLIENISCMEMKSNFTTNNIVQDEITEELIKSHEINLLDINSNKNCERKVLKEVQEKQEHTEQISSIKMKTDTDGSNELEKTANEFEDQHKHSLNNECKIENLMNKERLKIKRLAIINRVISNRTDHPPIPLSYVPLTVANITLDNEDNSKENNSNRRILLRSCNNLKSTADASDSKSSKKAFVRKMKVRLKDERPSKDKLAKNTNKLDLKADSSNKDETVAQKKSTTELKKKTKNKGQKNISTGTISSRKNNKKCKLTEKVDNQTEDICAQVNNEALNVIDIQKLQSNIPKILALPQHDKKDSHEKVTTNDNHECSSRNGAPISNHMQNDLVEMEGLSKQNKLNSYPEKKEKVSQQLPMKGNLQIAGDKMVEPLPVPVRVLKSAKAYLPTNRKSSENLNIDREIMAKYRDFCSSTTFKAKPLKFVEESVENKQILNEKDRSTNNSDILKASNLEQIFQINAKQKSDTDNCLRTSVFTHVGATRLDSNKNTIINHLTDSNIQGKSEQAQSPNRKSDTCYDFENSLKSKLTTSCEVNQLPSTNVTETKVSSIKSKQNGGLIDSNASTNCSEMAYLKNNITIEELPSETGDPNNKCVRLKLANGKVFKATVFGKMHVSFETLFANPALKNTLLSDLNQSSQRYTLNIKQVSLTNKADPSKIIDTRIEEIKLNCKERIIETVDLLSDDEEEIFNNIQSVVTEFGNYKISPVDEQDFEKHKHKLKQKCYVKIQQQIKVKIIPKQPNNDNNKVNENTKPTCFETKNDPSTSAPGQGMIPDIKTPDIMTSDIITSNTMTSDKNTADIMTSEINTSKIKTPDIMTLDKKSPDVMNPHIKTRDIIILASDLRTPEITAPDITAPDMTTPDITMPDITTPHITTLDITTPHITTLDITTPYITAPDITTPVITMPDITTPDIITPYITSPDITTLDIGTPEIITPDKTISDKEKIEIPILNFNSMLTCSEVFNTGASEVIEIDDSSNDSINLLLNCPILPILQKSGNTPSLAEKTGASEPVKILSELKHLLLKDLGVDDTVIENEVCDPEIHQLTVSNDSSTCETCPKVKECHVELSRCDYLVKQYEQTKIIKQKCTVDLIRCDDLIGTTLKSSNNNMVEIGSDDFIDVEGIDVECESLSHLSRSGSFSILNDFSFYNEKTTENYESANVSYNYDRSSPVIDVFETIVAFKNYSITNKGKISSEQNRLKCYSEWNKTKPEHYFESCVNKNDYHAISDKFTVDNTTSPNNSSEKLILPSLKSLTAKIFQDNSILDHYTICTQFQKSCLINTNAKQSTFHSLKRKINCDESKSFENKILKTLTNRKFLDRHTNESKCQQDSKSIKSEAQNIKFTEVAPFSKSDSYSAAKTIQADITSDADAIITESLDSALKSLKESQDSGYNSANLNTKKDGIKDLEVSLLINDMIELVEKSIIKTTESNECYTNSKVTDDGQNHNVYLKSHKENINEHLKINNETTCNILVAEKIIENIITEYDAPVSNMEVLTEKKTAQEINSQLNKEPEVNINLNITAAREPRNDEYDYEVNIISHNLDYVCVSASDELPQQNNAIVHPRLRTVPVTHILGRLMNDNDIFYAQNAIVDYDKNVKTFHNMTNVAVNYKTNVEHLDDSCTDDTCLILDNAHTSTADTETSENKDDTSLILDNDRTATANTETSENKDNTDLILDNARISTENTETSKTNFTDELSDSHNELMNIINNCDEKVSNVCKNEINSEYENDLRSYDSKIDVVKDEILSDYDSHQNYFDSSDMKISATINTCNDDNVLKNDIVELKCEEISTSSFYVNEKSPDANVFKNNGFMNEGYNCDDTVINIERNNSAIATDLKLEKQQVAAYENEECVVDNSGIVKQTNIQDFNNSHESHLGKVNKDPKPPLDEEVIYYDENVIDSEINEGETKDTDQIVIVTCLKNTDSLDNDYVRSDSEELFETSENAVQPSQSFNSFKILDHGYALQSETSSELECLNINKDSKAEQNEPVNLLSSLIKDVEVSGKLNDAVTSVEATSLELLEGLENPACKEITLVYKDGTDLVLKGIEYKDPVVGTCYLFPLANKSNLHNEIDDSEEVIQVTQNLDKDVTIDKSFDDEYVLELKIPNMTYSKRAKIPISKFKKNKCNMLKRKRDMSDVRYIEKRYRKGKQIDYPRNLMPNPSHNKEYKRVFDYCTSLKFSFSQPFHKENIDVEEMLTNWPIKGSCYSNLQVEIENENMLFHDDEKGQATENLTEMSFVEEINANYVECDLLSENVDEANFNMGFGEGSDRVIQNLKEDDDVSKFSAATLSDVKQPQPFLLSEDYDECDNELNVQENTKEDQLKTIKRYMTYIHLRDKVRSFFKKTTVELCNEWIRQKKDSAFNSKPTKKDMANFPFDLYLTDFIEPSPIETVVQVVQVGQLPVSAAAQNPVTCDPRVTQVSDASPSQCSVDNSPQDDSQVTIKTEYTELTTADFTLPLMHEHVQHNQNLLMESQDPTNYSICNENIPIETEIKSVVKIELEELAEVKEENREIVENNEFLPVENKQHDNHVEYLCDTSNAMNNETLETETETETDYQNMFNCTEKQDDDETHQQQQKQQNGIPEKTDQIAHAMNAAGITTTTETMASTTRAHALVNILSQKLRQGVVNTTQAATNSYSKTTAINAMALQQALAQILPPPLNQTNSNENNHQSSNAQMTPQVLHIVQGKNATGSQITLVDNSQQSVINNPNATPVLHIVQNKSGATGINSNGTATSQANSFSGLSLVDAGLQQGGNQLLHIVNTGSQKSNNAAGQLLKRVNLLTNLTNVQGSNEQKMVQFVCKSADGKSIQLNAPHQRSMVLRLQPIEPPNCNVQAKPAENQDAIPNANSLSGKESQQEIKSRSVYEENYAKFIQNSSSKSTISDKSTSLPKFNQAFGKPVFQDGNQKQNDINTNNSHLQAINNNSDNNECQPNDNAINLDHIGQINSPPLLLRKSPQTSQSQANLVQQLKQTIAPMNIQTMHGGVIYTRQIPVNIGGGQTINLITVPSTELMDDSASKQSGNQGEMEQSIIKIVPQNQNNSNNDMALEDGNATISGSNDMTPNSQPQPVLTQMRIKLPMLSKAPQMVSGARVVRPSFFQIQRNVIGGANQPVYQQLVLTAAPPLGQQTIRLPQTQTSRPMKVATDNQSTAESQMSSSTLEQLREFDMVLEQVKERSTVQPSSSTNTTFPKLHTSSSDTTDGGTSASSTSNETTQQVLYSIGNNQPLNVAYVNRKATVTTPVTSTFVRSPDSSGIIDSPTSTHVQIPHTVTSETTQNEPPAQPKPAKTSTKTKSRPKASSNPPNTLKLNTVPPKTSAQKPLEDEQTTQRILYILAEYKEQVENSPDKDKPAPRRRTNPPSNPGSSKRKKSSSSRRHGVRDLSPMHGEDTCRTMGSEDSSCGTSQGDCNESCLESHSPQDSPRKVVRKLTFEHETPTPQPRPQPQRNVIVADGQTITVARGTAGKPATAVLMPANYILPVSMVKGGQQIAIVTNRGPKLLTVGGEGGATNALLLQRLIGPAGLKPVLTRPGVRHVRLPTAALHNLQAFNLATATTIQPPDSTASPAPSLNPPELVDTRATSSPWTDRDTQDVKPERASSPEGSEPWHLPSSGDPHDYSYEETVRTDNLDRTVLDPIPDRYSPDMEAQRIFDKMFDVESKKSYMGDSHDDSPRCAYDIDASDCDDKAYHQVVQKKDGHRQHRLTHVSAAALRHKYAILEHELRLQKSLSEECEDLGVDSPSASELFPEAELLFAASPAHDHNQDQGHHSHTPQPTMVTHSGIPQPDMDDQIATDQLLSRTDIGDQQDLNLGLEDVGIVTVSEDGMQATIALDQEEFARSHPNTTFHSEPTDVGVVQPFTIANLKGRHITSTIFHSNRAPATVLMTAPQTTVISQATSDSGQLKYDIGNMIQTLPTGHNINLASVLVKDDGLTRFDSILNDSRELHLSNTASAIVHSAGNATQVIRRVCYDDDKRDTRFLMDEPDALIAGDDAKMIAEDSSRDATMESMTGDMDNDRSSPERHAELFWESNSASERSESRRPLDFSSDSEKCCKSPSYDETNSTDSSGVGTHMRLDSVIKEARGIERSNSADGSSADDTHPPLRTYPPKRLYHPLDGDVERSLSGKTRAGERSPDSLEVRRRASGRGVVKRGCHCCNGEPAPPRPKKARQRKPTTDFTTN